MATVFYLVRHRESEKNLLEIHHSRGIEDFSLTEKGLSGAERLITQFSDKTIDVIYTSPYKRCIQTIDPLSRNRYMPFIVDERITELDVGNLDRTPWKESWDVNRKLTNIPLGVVGESLLHCRNRVWSFLDEMKKQHNGKSIVICSHGEPLLFAKQYFLGFDYNNGKYRDTQYPAKDGYDECILDESGRLVSHCSHGNAQI